MNFEPAPKELFYTRGDPSDARRGETVRAVHTIASADCPGIVMAGYPDDEGIRNNQGRAGAKEGPNEIRKLLYRMSSGGGRLFDLGNLQPDKLSLGERHEKVRETVSSALKSGHQWIGLGGGHDYAYADGAGFLDWVKSQNSGAKPVLINFDAHLDVRPLGHEINSGTAFYRLAEHSQEYDLVQVGIQRQCNSESHLKWSRNKGHILITLDDYWNSHVSLDEYLIKQLEDLLLKKRPCFISVDIDAFAWPYAMGSSQSWPTGLEPKEFWPCFEILLKRWDVRVLGVYETSPPLASGDGTARLSALIADTFIRSSST